jgi:hypothetical protein
MHLHCGCVDYNAMPAMLLPAGAVQNRTAVLSLYCIVQVLSTTALSTIAGLSLSLFTAFRLVLLLLAFYLRRQVQSVIDYCHTAYK